MCSIWTQGCVKDLRMTMDDNEKFGPVREALGAPGPTWEGSRSPSETAGSSDQSTVAQVRVGNIDLEMGTVRRRAAGWLIDSLLLGIAVFLFTALLGMDTKSPSVENQVLVLLFRVGYNWPWNSIGWSPGKRAVGLRLVRVDGGGPPGPVHGFGRSVGALVSDLVMGFGYLWAIWDRNNQTWHDRLAGTYVVRLNEGNTRMGLRS